MGSGITVTVAARHHRDHPVTVAARLGLRLMAGGTLMAEGVVP